MSFRSIREVLTYSYGNEIILEIEFVLLYDHYKLKNPNFSYEHNSRFAFDDLEDSVSDLGRRTANFVYSVDVVYSKADFDLL